MASMTSKLLLLLCMGFNIVELVNANAFLGGGPKVAQEWVSETDVQATLLAEIMDALGSGVTDGRLTQIEDAARPMYTSLPKNEYGNLGHSTVRYALHRLFVQRHGWFVKGLEPGGGSWNVSSPAGILKDRVPDYIQGLFEQRMGGHGLNLHEVAVLASTIEHLVHSEVDGRLKTAFKARDMRITDAISEEESLEALETYMMAYILGKNLTSMRRSQISALHSNIYKIYPFWGDTRQWFHQLHQDVISANLSQTDPSSLRQLDYEAVARTANKIGEDYGRFQNKECQDLRRDFIKLEDHNSGRVLLSKFYQAALGGMFQFSEQIAYLRELGALDESGPGEPSVIVANYIGASSNCIASSSFYSVCCLDECEGLMGHLETKVAAPHAQPAAIAALVATLPSATVTAPRSLPPALLQRLDEIAASNGGDVPLHGRLFAQWMHHAFPRECPYPHISGTTIPRTPDEWRNQTGLKTSASKGEMRRYTEEVRPQREPSTSDEEDVSSLPWEPEEELLVIRPPSQLAAASAVTLWAAMRNIMLVVAVGGLASILVQSARSGARALTTQEPQKFYV